MAKFVTVLANNVEPNLLKEWVTASRIIIATPKSNSNNQDYIRPIFIGSNIFVILYSKDIIRYSISANNW